MRLQTVAGGDAFLCSFAEYVDFGRYAWLGFLSGTSVYGNKDGAWVDEESSCTPTSKRGRARVKAERQIRALAPSAHIFRLPGIYGPGRGPLQKVRNGKARRLLVPNHCFSRIHIDDIINTLRQSIARPSPGTTYNVVDDLPAPNHEVSPSSR